MSSSSFHELVARVRSQLAWRKHDGWLPSRDSGGTVPWSWVCVELCRLLAAYPGGTTLAAVVSELQRKWNGELFSKRARSSRPLLSPSPQRTCTRGAATSRA